LMHHQTDEAQFCPVEVTIHCLDHLHGTPNDMPISSYRAQSGWLQQLRPTSVEKKFVICSTSSQSHA
jgi:hypothetical protein